MSRSHRHHPIIGHTSATREKRDKRLASGRLRSVYRCSLVQSGDADYVAPDWRIVGHGSWLFAKDGKHWVNPQNIVRRFGARFLRKLLKK